MKNKLFILFIIVFLLNNPVKAQTFNKCGIKGGLINNKQKFVNLSEDELFSKKEFKRRNGLLFGFFKEWAFSPALSVLTQLEYIQKGTSLELTTINYADDSEIETTQNYRINYIYIPVLAKFNLPVNKMSPYFIAGPGINYVIGYGDDSKWLYEDFKKLIIGMSMGLGFKPDISKSFNPLFEFRYDFDLMNSYDKINQLSGKKIDIRNSSLNFIMGLYF